MKPYTIVLILTILLPLSGCDKGEYDQKTFLKSRFEAGEVHLYAKGGEITESGKIEKFTERISDLFSVFDVTPSLDSNIIEYDKADFTIELLSPTNARFVLGNGDIREFIIARNNGVISFIQDSIVSTAGSLNEVWFKFKPDIIRTEPIPFGQLTYYRPTIFAYEVNGEIRFPVLSFMAYYKQGATYYLRQGNSISDVLLAKISEGINPNDTIVFRESQIVFAEN